MNHERRQGAPSPASGLLNADLNLLVVLDALLEERHLTRAGRRLYLSQPAVSGALKRLRVLFDDELLHRVGNEMQLTPKARSLRPEVHALLVRAQSLLNGPDPFDPADAAVTIRIATTDHVIVELWPHVQEILARVAPGLNVRFVQYCGLNELELLNAEELDLVLASFLPAQPNIRRQVLWRDPLVCVLRSGHPALTGIGPDDAVPLQAYLSAPHIRIATSHLHSGPVAEVFADLRLDRRVAIELPDALAAPILVAAGDQIAVMAESLARRSARALPLEIRRTPFDLPPLETEMVWHARLDDAPLQVWLRHTIFTAAASVRAMTPDFALQDDAASAD